ncbi:site-2 protease family protein [Candidatus Parcubacteria bacterium]|nr:site-2 protease family protein [Candidatus Parcubacteria bacterium]
MISIIFLVFISIVGLLALHEFGHFITAKKFGIKVEEFGIGYPPRLFGKKFGETLYSVNLLPFGAFVSIPSMEGGKGDDPNSFCQKPIWQRGLVLFAGVAMFWFIAWIIFSAIMILGVPTAIDDDAQGNFSNPEVKIIAVAQGSPAQEAGISLGDTIKEISAGEAQFSINRVDEVQELIETHKGEEITLTIQRGEEIKDISLVPRIQPPEGEGAIGISLSRVAMVKHSWWTAPFKGMEATYNTTLAIIDGFATAISRAIGGLPSGVQFMGPIGIVSLMGQVAQIGIIYYLQFIAIISIHLAIFNLLPIPAIDGGRIFFLGIEKMKGSPINQKIEQKINNGFFILLIIIMILVTFKDIQALL